MWRSVSFVVCLYLALLLILHCSAAVNTSVQDTVKPAEWGIPWIQFPDIILDGCAFTAEQNRQISLVLNTLSGPRTSAVFPPPALKMLVRSELEKALGDRLFEDKASVFLKYYKTGKDNEVEFHARYQLGDERVAIRGLANDNSVVRYVVFYVHTRDEKANAEFVSNRPKDTAVEQIKLEMGSSKETAAPVNSVILIFGGTPPYAQVKTKMQ